MAAPVLVRVDGARELRASLRRAGVDLAEMKAAHAVVAKIAENSIRAAAPASTGRMKGTIRSSGTQRAAIVRAGRASVPYAGPNNWGWPQSSGGIRGDYAGGHWMQRGARASESTWLAAYENEVQKIASRVRGI